jgi:predicted aspartyl protease
MATAQMTGMIQARVRSEALSCFSVEVELSNRSDELLRQLIPEHEVRRELVWGRVDSGADLPILPEQLAVRLGLPDSGQLAEVTLADGSILTRRIVSDLKLRWQDRWGIFDAIVEPGREDLLIGALVLERLDLLVDCRQEQLVPRHPNGVRFRA